MDQDPSFSRGFFARLSRVSLNLEPQASPFLNGKQQRIPEPQATLETEDHGQEPQEHGGHDTKAVPVEAVIRMQRDPERLQACLKPHNMSDEAQPASGAHPGGVHSTTTRNTTASLKLPGIAKPSLLQSQPAPTVASQPKANDDGINKEPETRENTAYTSVHPSVSAPPRKSLPTTSTLQVRSAKQNKDFRLPRPILNNTKNTNIASSIPSSIEFPNRSLSTASRNASQHKKLSRHSSSLSTTAPRPHSSISRVYFKGNGSYYTPFDPTSLGKGTHPSNRAMDNKTSTGIKIRPSLGKDYLDSTFQLSQPVPEVPVYTSMGPRQEAQPASSAGHVYSGYLDQSWNRLENLEPSAITQQALESDRASEDSELSDVESIDFPSSSSNNTASAPSQSPTLVIADSDDDNNDVDEDDDKILYEDQPGNDISATNKSVSYTGHTKHSALDDAAYRTCKDQFGNIVKTEGALIPVGYQLLDGDFPWICPVRSCRTLHSKIKALGNHFSHGHKGACLNDNLDGTLTFLGLYTTKQMIKQPPIIVSKKAMSLDDSPMLEPSHTAANYYKYKVGFPEKALNEQTLRREAHTKEVVSSQAIVAVQGPPLPKPEKVFTMADPDRPYNMWPDPTGKLEHIHGCLLPSGWTPYYEYPTRQWICPIRSCQCLVHNRYHLGRHFLAHRGCHLNDNLDGTFTILRSPSQAQLDDKDYTDTPAAVVSREPLDNEPIQPPKIRIQDPSGTQPVWVSLSSYLASAKRGHTKDVKEPTPDRVPTKIRIVQSGPKETPFKPATEAHFDEELIMATKDRKYSVWGDADHGLKDTHGALIPEGYELDKTWPGRPWICPIRSCRVVCKTTWTLGSHFAMMHSSAKLNDNKDGTFSIVGTHQLGAPRVVSKRLVSLHKDPIVEARLPVLKKKEIEEEQRKRSQMGTSMDKPATPKPTADKPAADPEELWKYICSMVDRDLARPSNPSFEHLMALPRIRDLNIIDKKLGPKHLIRSTLAVGLVIQVTGVERQTKQCTACRRGDGPFHECVSICPELANEVAELNPPLVTSPTNRWCCMNCVVNRQTSQCSLKASLLERSEDGSVKENIPQWMMDSERPAVMIKPKAASQDLSVGDEVADKDVDLVRQDATSFSYRRSGRLRLQVEAKPSESQKRSFASTDMASAQVAAAASQEEEASSLRAPKRVRALQSPSNIPPSAVQESLMVEDWEGEAKAIPRENGASDNLAVSSSYNLSTHQNPSTSSTQICSSPSFSMHVLRIPSGGSHYLGAVTSDESHQNRMCTVIAGKLRVKVKVKAAVEDGAGSASTEEFNIGLLGVFKLAVGMECRVENWGYIEAVLQVVSV
ncbi:hypothetical protein QBC32DRAFT_259265 [Pseudoneurospora amorphoporcata]|uniref:C2H2-type domain-containing protein n=1 Tax=Pseudoneurospora amorphoporcata TaxID=241081 RepID=A0AAN6NVL1_9PEZI|nr:hypothetical protein QBC32DRAFT_259265 [Pseudoneurospora amorphoporcata]